MGDCDGFAEMDRILSVDPYTRTGCDRSGVTVGQMIGYLKHNYPELRFSIPDAPPPLQYAEHDSFSDPDTFPDMVHIPT